MSLEHPTLSRLTKWSILKIFSRFQGKKKKKGLIFGLIVLLGCAGALASSALPLQGKVLTVHPAEFSKGFTEEAQVQALSEWPIYSSIDGKIQALHVQNGDHVTKGQVLVELDTQDLNHQLDVLKAQLTSVEGQRQQAYRTPQEAAVQQQSLLIEQAEKDSEAQDQALARSKALYEAGAISQVEYEDAQRQADKAKSNLEQQKLALQLLYEQQAPAPGTALYFSGQKEALNAQISQLEDKIQKAKITAPQDGIIKDLTLKEGMAAPNGQLLLTVVQNEGYRLESYVLASDALDLKAGSSVKILQATSSGDKSLSGKIESIAPSAVERVSPLGLKENRVKVTLLLDTNSPVVLGSNMDVQFVTYQESNRLLVPKTALFPYQNGQAIWVIRNGKAAIQPVTKGIENNQECIIEKGLQDGDQVLLDTSLKGLKEGKRIKAAQ